MREFHSIVEYAFNAKKALYIVRFLDGTCLRVPIEQLPAKYKVKSADWERTELSKDKAALIIPAGKKKLNLPAHVLYVAGRTV